MQVWRGTLILERGFSEQPVFYLSMEGWDGVFKKMRKDGLREKEESMSVSRGAGESSAVERYKISCIVSCGV